jgi:hypothetical protein
MSETTVVAITHLLIGIASLAVAGRLAYRQKIRLAVAGVAQGLVVEIAWRRERGSDAYYRKIKFRTHSGQEFWFFSKSDVRPTRHRVGQSVRVRFMKDRPPDAWIDSFARNWGGPSLLGVFGGAFTLFGVVGLSQ